MQIKKFTQASMEVSQMAEREAIDHGNQEIKQEHLVLAMLDQKDGLIPKIFERMEIDTDMFRKRLLGIIDTFPRVDGNTAKTFIGKQLNDVLTHGDDEAEAMKDDYVSVEHLFLSLIKYQSDTIKTLFDEFGITRSNFMQALKGIRGNVHVTTTNPEATYDVLEKYGYDMVEQAKKQQTDPVIGRDTEIRNVIRILSRKTKNNPILIGEPGVGKTAAVEGLAQRIASGDVPDNLENKKIFSLDVSSLVAGASLQGEFEERLKAVLQQVSESNGDILLFIDEIHMIVGAGKSGGAMDAGNILKPMLARGQLHCIGATTIDEYREYIEKDPALARRFQPVIVNEPSVEDTISILRGIKDRYENYHGVKIQDAALVAAATLSSRYITDRHLPDKAIDLVDEACASVKTAIGSMPPELDELDRKVMQLEIEEAALKKETDFASQERLDELKSELSELKDDLSVQKAQWENEKSALSKVTSLRKKIEAVNKDIKVAQQNYDLDRAAELQYGKLPKLKDQLAAEEQKVKDKKLTMIHESVDEDEIASVVSRWTGIPIQKLNETERAKIVHLEDTLHKRIIGQNEAVRKLSKAILRSRAGINDPTRPIGSFLLLGPTGVGKTELAKALAEALFDDENSMIRLDMSEYMDKASTEKLIGAPPGYIGYEQGGQLTEAVRMKPYSVVLFDEMEKANLDVYNLLLQILDDGRLTDSHGRTVDFKNTVIIMTSNLGAEEILNGTKDGNITKQARDAVNQVLYKYLKPEFLNRLDEILLFQPLTVDDVCNIAGLFADNVVKRMKERGYEIEFTDEAIQYIGQSSYDPEHGARPVRRFMQKYIDTAIAESIMNNEVGEDEKVVIDAVDEDGELNLVIENRPKNKHKKTTDEES